MIPKVVTKCNLKCVPYICTLRVKGMCESSEMGLKQGCECMFTNKLNLHKPNNKLVDTKLDPSGFGLSHEQPKFI